MNLISSYIDELRATLDQLPVEKINQMIGWLHETRIYGRQVFVMGNGGSASTAQHFICDLSKNTRQVGWPSFRAIGLADNMAMLSAYANDEGYENVFCQQLENLIQPEDIVIAISTSGNSRNVVSAVELANRMRAKTVGLTGVDGGRLGPLVDLEIRVPSYNIQQIEDTHMAIEHMVCSALITMSQMTDWIDLKNLAMIEKEKTLLSMINTLFEGISVAEETNVSELGYSTIDIRQRISPEIEKLLELPSTISRLLQLILNGIRAESGTIILLDRAGKVVDGALVFQGEVQNASLDQLTEVSTEGLAGWVARHRQPVLIENTLADPRWLHREWEKDKSVSRSALSIPLTNEEVLMGVLTVVNPQTNQFTNKDLVLLTNVSQRISSTIDKASKTQPRKRI